MTLRPGNGGPRAGAAQWAQLGPNALQDSWAEGPKRPTPGNQVMELMRETRRHFETLGVILIWWGVGGGGEEQSLPGDLKCMWIYCFNTSNGPRDY